MKGSSMRTTMILAVVGLTALLGCPTPPPPAKQAPAPAQILAFAASEAVVEAGTRIALSWETKEVTTLELRDARKGVISGVDGSKATGTLEVNITEDTLFVLTAGNSRGQLDTAALTVRVRGGADEVVFAASPHRITAGDPVLLAWVADGAREVSLATEAGEAIDVGGQRESGQVRVYPKVDTVYALKVDGRTRYAQVKVRPIVSAFTATPAAAKAGEIVTLAWKTVGANQVILSQGGVGQLHSETDAARLSDGTFEVTVPAKVKAADVLTFDLLAQGSEAESTTSARVEVYIAGAPKIRDWKVPEYAKLGTRFQASWSTLGADLVEILKDGQVIYTSPTSADAAQGTAQLPTPATDAKYQLRARDFRGGVALSAELNVNPVAKPTVDLFTATPSSIPFGGDGVTLTWNVPYARNLYILANGKLLVHAARGVGVGVASISAYPNEDTVYELRADNGAGDRVSATAQVTVGTPAGLTWAPTKAPLGRDIELVGTTLGTGDVVGLPWINVGKHTFEDISRTGVPVTDDGSGSEARLVQLPKPFSGVQFGLPFTATDLNVSVNGWFRFGNTRMEGVERPTGDGITSDLPPGAIAPYFDALFDINGGIYVQVDDLSPTEQRLIVQWSGLRHSDDAPPFGRLTFQAQVYSDGRVVFAYDQLDSGGVAAPLVGLVDPFGATALETEHDPVAGDFVSFYEPATPPVALVANLLPYTLRTAMPGGFLQFHEAYPFIPPDQFEVTEVAMYPPAGITDGQWFEVLNKTGAPIDLSGWTIEFGNGTTHTIGSATLPAHDRLVFGQSATAGDGVVVDYVYGNGIVLAPGDKVEFQFGGGAYTSMELPPWNLRPGYTWQVGEAAAGLVVAPDVRHLACAAANTSNYGTHGAHGTPGDPNTPCMTYQAPQMIPNDFRPIVTTGTRINFGGRDEGLEQVVLPAPINVMQFPFDRMTVSNHGFLTPRAITCPVGQPCYGISKRDLDRSVEPFGLIAPFWDALHDYQAGNEPGHAGAGVYWQYQDPDNVPGSGDEVAIFSWEGMGRSIRDRYDDIINAQVKFFPNGTIEIHYGDIREGDLFNNPFGGLWAWSGLEDPMGYSAWVINNHTHFPGIRPFTAYRFTLR